MNELLFFILIPLVTGIINWFLPIILRKVLTFLSTTVGLYLVFSFYQTAPEPFILFNETIFTINSLGLFTALFIQILSFVILIYSLYGVPREIEKSFFYLYPLTVAFCQSVVLSDNSISFILFWGLSGLTLYLFATLGSTNDSPVAAKKTFIIIGGSDAFLLMGIILLYILSPTSSWSLSSISSNLDNNYSIIAFVFLLIAAFAKAGAFPLHTWVPDFAQNSPVESSAFLPASLDKLLGIFLLAKMLTQIFIVDLVVNLILISLGALTVITAVMMAMIQHNGYRLLGYHAVSQVGYMVMGVASGHPLAFAGGIFHMINHTIYKSNLFLSLGSVEKRTGTPDLNELGGLGKNMPLTFLMALIGALSISGIPPFNGFFSKWMIYQGLLNKTSTLSEGYQIWLLICIVIAIFGSALTLASFLKFLHATFLGKKTEKYKDTKEAPFNQWFATGILSLLCLVFGVFAVVLPLKKLIFPLTETTLLGKPEFIGLYEPVNLLLLFIIIFLVGMIIYATNARVRFDEVYVGGTPAFDKYRVSGTEFYNEVRNSPLLKAVYNFAERKYFDLYELFKNFTLWISEIFQKAHPGLLQLYLLYLLIGFMMIMLLL